MVLYEALRAYGGIWIIILVALSWIAFAKLSQIQDQAQRWV